MYPGSGPSLKQIPSFSVNGSGAVLLAALSGVPVPYDKEQKIRASLVTRPVGTAQTNLRVTFQCIVWNSQNVVSRTESIEDAELYQDFFVKLSKAVFLEANEI